MTGSTVWKRPPDPKSRQHTPPWKAFIVPNRQFFRPQEPSCLRSSVAAIAEEGVKGKVFTDNDWNTKSTLKRLHYYFCKARAEKAAWDWAENHKNVKVVVINPFVVIGPSIAKSLDESAKVIQDTAVGNFPGGASPCLDLC